MSINVLDLLLINLEEQRAIVVRGGSLVSCSCEMTGLATGEGLEKTSHGLSTLELTRVDFSLFGDLEGSYDGRRCLRQLADFFEENLFRAWEQTLPLHMKIRNFSTKPAWLIKTLLSEPSY